MTYSEALTRVAIARSGMSAMPDTADVHKAYRNKLQEILRDAIATQHTVMAVLGRGQVDVFTNVDKLFQARPRMVSYGSANDIRMVLLCQALLTEIAALSDSNKEGDMVTFDLLSMALSDNTAHFLWPEDNYASE